MDSSQQCCAYFEAGSSEAAPESDFRNLDATRRLQCRPAWSTHLWRARQIARSLLLRWDGWKPWGSFSPPAFELSPPSLVRRLVLAGRQCYRSHLTHCTGSTLLGSTYTSPLHTPGTPSAPRPLIPASYVTSTTGTGLVHTAPAHGMEDWEAWRAFRLASRPGEPLKDVLCAVDGAGRFSDVLGELVEDDVRLRLEGKDILKEGTQSVIEVLQERGTLLKEVEVSHKFPYDWRTKKPVIFRCVATQRKSRRA